MIGDLTLRWVVTILFGLAAAECTYAILSRHGWAHRVGHLLHLVMAIAMAVMAWPWGAELPTTGPMVFFLAATVWFIWMLVTTPGAGARVINGYHALMMLAMAWMYAVMNGAILPGQHDHSGTLAPAAPAGGHHSTPAMPGMDMGGMDMSDTAAAGTPGWILGVNWLWTIGFAVAALFWACLYLIDQQRRPAPPLHACLGALSQAMMAAGMSIMFGVML